MIFMQVVKKLHARNVGPFKISNELNDNAYVIDLPKILALVLLSMLKNLMVYK